MQTVNVKLATCAYQVHVGTNLLADASLLQVAPDSQAVVVTDENVRKLHAVKLQDALAKIGTTAELISMPAGESSKSWDNARSLCDRFAQLKLNRDGWVVSVGGGVIGDLAGFAAGIYLRGVRHISVPTTLLAQVDASVGGKTGINIDAGKNLVGVFHHPQRVIADVTTLASMPAREYRAGFAEIVKHGLLEQSIFEQIQANAESLAQGVKGNEGLLGELIAQNVSYKAKIVSADEREHGVRAYLNLGHTFAHALEATLGYGKLLHGEAVAIGLVAACKLAVRLTHTSPELAKTVANLLTTLGLPVRVPIPLCRATLWRTIAVDKKTKDKKPHFVLPCKPGKVIIKSDVPFELVEKVLDEISEQA